MLAKEHLRDYLSTVRRRLRLEAVARGLAVCGLAALLLTVATVWLSDAWRFSDAIITFSRIVLLLGTGLVLALFLVRPLLRRLSNARIARFVEEKQPRFQDRLVTAVDLEDKLPRENSSRLFQELVAEDALAETATAPPSGLIQTSRILRPLLFAATSVAVLLLLSFFGPGFFPLRREYSVDGMGSGQRASSLRMGDIARRLGGGTKHGSGSDRLSRRLPSRDGPLFCPL